MNTATAILPAAALCAALLLPVSATAGEAAPLVGATNARHFDAAVRAVDLALAPEDVAFLEEPYRAHDVVGALPPPAPGSVPDNPPPIQPAKK